LPGKDKWGPFVDLKVDAEEADNTGTGTNIITSVGSSNHSPFYHLLPNYDGVISRNADGSVATVAFRQFLVVINRAGDGSVESVDKRGRRITINRNPDGSVASWTASATP